MSEEMRLPTELAACEARLAAHALPASGIDRDALLYQAGWAAAQAQAGVTHVPVDVGAEVARPAVNLRKSTFMWSAVSAAVAASIAVVATLELRPPRIVEVAAKSPSPAAQPLVEGQPAPRDRIVQATEPRRSPDRIIALRPEFEAGLIGLRQQALASMLRDRPHPASSSAEGGETPTTKTVRELMNELLPSDADRSAQIWPWSRLTPGEAI